VMGRQDISAVRSLKMIDEFGGHWISRIANPYMNEMKKTELIPPYPYTMNWIPMFEHTLV
jgi:hypothetical protein